MKHLELTYHIGVVLISIAIFFMNFSSGNSAFELFIKILGKLIPLFLIAFAFINIFKILGVI